MTVKELYDSLNLSGNPLNNNGVIKTFEDNEDFILNTDIYSSEESYFFITLFISQYGHALIKKNRYTKALQYLNRAIPLWENDSVFEREDLRNNWTEALRLDRGIANYYKYNISKAKEDFIWLTNYDPENERYKMWLMAVKDRRLEMICYGLLVVYLIAIFISIMLPTKQGSLKHSLDFFIIRPLFLVLLLTGIVATIRKWKMNTLKKTL